MDISRDGILFALYQQPRIWKYRSLSTCPNVTGSPRLHQPLLLRGGGTITIGRDVEFGWRTSDGFLSGYCHVEAGGTSVIQIGDGAMINNNVLIKSEGPGISIGARSLLGSGICIYDSDFHELHPRRRIGGRPAMAAVELGENVFIGDRVMILKGVTIGRDSAIGAGSVVTGSIPAGVIAAGNPARVVQNLSESWELQPT
jgi:acetyltransferase-like isoleucine patch superfamily enzyme